MLLKKKPQPEKMYDSRVTQKGFFQKLKLKYVNVETTVNDELW